jgi:sec-independent protein translocase protein TatA
MGAQVTGEIKALDGGYGQVPHAGFEQLIVARQGEHGAVVIRIRVDVEQAGASGAPEIGQDVQPAPFTDVDHAFEHAALGLRRCPETGAEAVLLMFMLLANIFGPDVIIVVVIAVVLLFGAGQLPKLARSVGEASKEFKKSQHEAEQQPSGDDKITLSKSELDALLAEREARAKRESGTPPTN